MEAGFCVEAVEEALARHGKPEIFNTDQGSQFTSTAFTGLLTNNAIAISMDGRGACWTAAGMMEAKKGFRRLMAYKQLPTLKAALLAHLVKNPGTVSGETTGGVRSFHRIVFQRCVRCLPILPESFENLRQRRLSSQSTARSYHRYLL